ncbi:MAG: nucleoside deaminase [Synergistes sp.]|nr:nucleoside deaminase [Synergistes sp.]
MEYLRQKTAQTAELVRAIEMPEWLCIAEAENIGRVIKSDTEKVLFAVSLAAENVRQGTGGPFAAAIFGAKNDRLAAIGVNTVVTSRQSWAHAEMTAFAHAQNKLNVLSLNGYILVSSAEPCAMCSGAVPWSGVDRLVYGAPREMAESVGFDEGYKGEKWREAFEARGIDVAGPLCGDAAFEPFALYKEKHGKIY